MEITVLGIQDRDATPTLEKRQEKRHGTGRNIYLGALLKSNLRLNFVLASSEWQKSMFRIRMWSYEIVSSCHCETRAICQGGQLTSFGRTKVSYAVSIIIGISISAGPISDILSLVCGFNHTLTVQQRTHPGRNWTRVYAGFWNVIDHVSVWGKMKPEDFHRRARLLVKR
ncbi:hypothetical protein BKA60DRAFT_621987 [Fusarium oxysporum]|nr:hypothetical protein BKA60DRAFT_621987 [Fusarium oxysporum]